MVVLAKMLIKEIKNNENSCEKLFKSSDLYFLIKKVEKIVAITNLTFLDSYFF